MFLPVTVSISSDHNPDIAKE